MVSGSVAWNGSCGPDYYKRVADFLFGVSQILYLILLISEINEKNI
jgi:hypothetical protein